MKDINVLKKEFIDIFQNNIKRDGAKELLEYLEGDFPKLTFEQAKFKQDLGLNSWDPLPEGVDYPEHIK